MGLVMAHVDDDLLGFVERWLDPAAARRVSAHLARCARCRSQAADLRALSRELAGLPTALRGLGGRGDWPAIWRRVRGAPLRGRAAPRLSFCLSLTAVAISAALAWPGTLPVQAGAVTAGLVETPRAAAHTPQAATAGVGEALLAASGAATAGLPDLPVGPAASETPAPGSQG
jgi:anti-sigma factor RsiW